jgi:hypothetical protein
MFLWLWLPGNGTAQMEQLSAIGYRSSVAIQEVFVIQKALNNMSL